MIEKMVKDYLKKAVGIPVFMEKPKNGNREYLLVEKAGSGKTNHIDSATVMIKSYAASMYDAAELNEKVKTVMDNMPYACDVYSAKLNTDYPLTDTQTKEYRYQAVYDITY